MLSPDTPTGTVIDRTACPSRRGHGTIHHRHVNGCTCHDSLEDARRNRLGLRYGDPVPEYWSPAVGTARRLQAAAARGWGVGHLAPLLGVTPQRVQQLRAGRSRKVRRDLAELVARVVEDLHARPEPVDVPGSCTYTWHQRARDHATAQGWVRLGEWEPDEIDDPDALPDSAHRRSGPQRVATEDLAELRGHGLTDDQIAHRVGMSRDAVQKRLDRLGDPRAGLTDDQVFAIRDAYQAAQAAGTPWSSKRMAAAYGCSQTVLSHVLQGKTRPHLGLTDLTAHPRGADSAAASPADSDDRKENAA